MVFITLPPNLTEEEELLQQKFAKLKKKVHHLIVFGNIYCTAAKF